MSKKEEPKKGNTSNLNQLSELKFDTALQGSTDKDFMLLANLRCGTHTISEETVAFDVALKACTLTLEVNGCEIMEDLRYGEIDLPATEVYEGTIKIEEEDKISGEGWLSLGLNQIKALLKANISRSRKRIKGYKRDDKLIVHRVKAASGNTWQINDIDGGTLLGRVLKFDEALCKVKYDPNKKTFCIEGKLCCHGMDIEAFNFNPRRNFTSTISKSKNHEKILNILVAEGLEKHGLNRYILSKAWIKSPRYRAKSENQDD